VGFLYALLNNITDRFDVGTALLFILLPIFFLIVDGRRYKVKGDIKEYNIIKAFSYFYMSIGIIFLMFLWVS